MIEKSIRARLASISTRRQVIAGATFALGGLAAGSTTLAQAPGTSANQTRTSLHQDVELKASPERIYDILLDSKQFAGFSGMPPADIDPKAGGAFSMFKGMIVGRTIELIPSQRIVQAWRPTHWDPGFYSIVKFELKPQASGTMLALDHWGFPEGDYDHLFDGWNLRYWNPLKKYLG